MHQDATAPFGENGSGVATADRVPAVTVAIPVFNGERYLAAALDALLAQTWDDFEILVVDNASTDGSGDIAARYARQDPRVRSTRNVENIGAAPNFNRAFSLARGRYFKWAAHDDLCAPAYLARTVAALERDPSVVLCQSRVRIIDSDGRPVREEPPSDDRLGSGDVAQRLQAVMATVHGCFEVFGVIRSSTLRDTSLIGLFPAGDKSLLVELALRGRFEQVPEFAFLSRDHPSRYTRAALSGLVATELGRESLRRRTAWFSGGAGKRIVFPQWRFLGECARAVLRSTLSPRDRVRCGIELARYALWFRAILQRDAAIGLRELYARVRERMARIRAASAGEDDDSRSGEQRAPRRSHR